MQYKDLIQFDPLERIIQLTKSGEKKEAQSLVSSYVISEMMADRLINIVFKQLQFDEPMDNMGLLVVGNYGTGKSHLMSVISAIAADADMVQFVTNPAVARAAQYIAGKFKVIRVEIGSVNTSFREIIVHELEEFLASEGISFSIPTADSITNNKGWLEDMMAAFNAKYPDYGLLFVVDELLDYLRSRRDMELARDFGFMRELGEVCKDLRFRFIAGLQEALFDSVRFAFASDSLRRVHERFEQVDIARNDVKFVVAERLLRKTPEQQKKIRSYLEQFAPFYGDMTARMDDFVKMFPVHPDYIDIFERIVAVEKRMVLRTLSAKMAALLNLDVPEDYPGIIAYDSYWDTLTGNASFRTIEDVKRILDCTSILATKIKTALKKPYQSMAMRIINGLAVNRLTTGSIYNPVGVTLEEMRDSLCLYDTCVKDLGGEPAEDLKTRIEFIMKRIREAVSGQFITQNADNHQYYIDVQRIVDYDALIEQKAATLNDEKLDHAYYEALKIMMEVQDVPTKVTGYNIWEYDKITWLDHQAPRCGYLFFGAPNDRSTAQPPRDYYIYFLRHFSPGNFRDERKADEVFFKLAGVDDTLTTAIRNFAGALELTSISSGSDKSTYSLKVQEYKNAIVKWLKEKNTSAFEITYQGHTKTLANWLKGTSLRQLSGIGNNETLNFRDMVNTISAFLMGGYFQEQAPDYPKFRTTIAVQMRPQAVTEALRVIAGGHSKQGRLILDALNLLDEDRISTANSKYAKRVLALFQNRGAGQVVNYDELVQYDKGGNYFDPNASRLEAEYLIVVLAALVCTGEITLSVLGERFDATGLGKLAATPLDTLVAFKHIEQPKEWNLPALTALFELVGLPAGYASMVTLGKEQPIVEMQTKISSAVDRIVHIQSQIRNGMSFLGVDLLSICKYTGANAEIAKLKDFLEYMQNFNAPSKLKQLKKSKEEIDSFKATVAMVKTLGDLRDFMQEETQTASYLQAAETCLPPDNAWIAKEQDLRQNMVEKLAAAHNADEVVAALPGIAQDLHLLKKEYIVTYMKLHKDARLTVADETKRGRLRNDNRLKALQALSVIDLMPRQKLQELIGHLDEMRSCSNLTEMALQTETICGSCRYTPSREHTHGVAADILRAIDSQLDDMLEEWTKSILNSLEDPVTKENLELLQPDEKTAIQTFIAGEEFVLPIDLQLVKTLKQVMGGLLKVAINVRELETALQNGGPAKADELQQRFASYIEKVTHGKDLSKTRIVLE